MNKINSAADLREAILQLEIAHAEEGVLLKEQFHLAYESIKPINLIKSVFRETTASPDLKKQILYTSAGMAAGHLSKVLFQAIAGSPLKGVIGTVLKFGITKVVTKNPEAVKALGKGFLRIIRNKLAGRVNATNKF